MQDVISGFRPLGPQKPFGIYREKFSEAAMPISELLVRMQPEMAKLRCRQRPNIEQARTICEKNKT